MQPASPAVVREAPAAPAERPIHPAAVVTRLLRDLNQTKQILPQAENRQDQAASLLGVRSAPQAL